MSLGYYKMRFVHGIEQFWMKLLLRLKGNQIQKGVSISKDSVLAGNNYVGEYSKIINSAVIGKNCVISNFVTLSGCKIGSGTKIEGFCIIQEHGSPLEIGDDCYISSHSTLESTAPLKIGNHVSIGPNFKIVTHSGHIQALTDAVNGSTEHIINKPVTIEDHVYIGVGTIILMGVTIGRYSVVNAGSIVTKYIPPYSFAQGTPAKVVGRINIIDNLPVIEKF